MVTLEEALGQAKAFTRTFTLSVFGLFFTFAAIELVFQRNLNEVRREALLAHRLQTAEHQRAHLIDARKAQQREIDHLMRTVDRLIGTCEDLPRLESELARTSDDGERRRLGHRFSAARRACVEAEQRRNAVKDIDQKLLERERAFFWRCSGVWRRGRSCCLNARISSSSV